MSNLEKLTLTELKDLAKKNNIKNISKLKKEELITVLNHVIGDTTDEIDSIQENSEIDEIEKKEGLLNDIEEVTDLKLMPLKYHKERLLFGRDYSFKYKDSDNNVFDGLSFEINNGDRVVIDGENGSGKSSLIKAILDMNRGIVKENANYEGEGILEVPENLVISYINQDTSHLKGFLKDYCELQGLDYTLFLSLLRQLDFERVQFVKPMEQYSEGQKKKVLIAASLLTSAHLYIWDEPLNYIDVFTRMQIEKLIETYRPTMLLVEHDVTFKEKIANKVIRL